MAIDTIVKLPPCEGYNSIDVWVDRFFTVFRTLSSVTVPLFTVLNCGEGYYNNSASRPTFLPLFTPKWTARLNVPTKPWNNSCECL
jgi:hypothetical protein